MTKVNFGCGGNRPPDFINHDSEVDITKPLPYPDMSVDFILAEHVMEHITGPEALRFLDECYRILKPNGVARVCVPVLDDVPPPHGRDLVLGHGHLVPYTSESLKALIRLVPWRDVALTTLKSCDGHWRVIGEEKDRLETCRVEATK